MKVEEGGSSLLFAARRATALPTVDCGWREGRRSGADRRDSADRRDAQWQQRRGATFLAAPIRNAAGVDNAALHAAVLRGDVGLVEGLVARGARVDARLERGTPVRRYAGFRSADPSAPRFWLAARYGEVPIMRRSAAGAIHAVVMPDGTNALIAAVAASGVRPGIAANAT